MRRVLLMIILLISTIFVQAQTNNNFTCLDETSHRTQFTISPPDISEFVTDVSVTTLGRGNIEPVIGITDAENFTDCYSYSSEAEFYDVTLPSGYITPSFTNASGLVYGLGENTIHIGDSNGGTGAFVVILESFIFETAHNYQFNITEEMLETGEVLNVYLATVSDEYEPSLTITDADGVEIIAEPSEIGLTSLYGDASASVGALLPSITDTIGLTINPNQAGTYALIFELQSGAVQLGDGFATVSTSEESTLTLFCDDLSVFENGMRLFFPDDNSYTTTILASSIDPIVAVVDDTDSGFCFDDSPSSLDYSIELPTIILERDIVYPQADITPQDNSLVLGGKESAPGSYLVMIEGGQISGSDEGDIFEIVLTPQMLTASDVLMAYVFTTEIELNPVLTWLADEGEAVVCNDASIPDLCDQEVEDFTDSFLTYGENLSLLGIDFNPMLEIPIDVTADTRSIRLQVTGADESTGEYILVLHMVSD